MAAHGINRSYMAVIVLKVTAPSSVKALSLVADALLKVEEEYTGEIVFENFSASFPGVMEIPDPGGSGWKDRVYGPDEPKDKVDRARIEKAVDDRGARRGPEYPNRGTGTSGNTPPDWRK